MFDRKEVKERGKIAFKANYWRCVLVAFILAIVAGASGSTGGSSSAQNASNSSDSLSSVFSSVPAAAWVAIAIFIVLFVAIAIGVGIFVFGPLELGCRNFFKRNLEEEKAELGALGYGFSTNYLRNVSTIFLRDLFIGLWTLLFIVPGIIKCYEYRMISYILADNPDITRKEAFALSKQMMDGKKWKTFVFDLSFFGWFLLSVITLGILGIFYVNPYYYSASANLYITLRDADKAAEPVMEDTAVEDAVIEDAVIEDATVEEL